MNLFKFPTLTLCLACAFHAHAQQQLPYNQTFDDANAFEDFVVLDANGDNYTWKYDSFSAEASCERDMYADADDWLFTPVFALKAGTEYTLSFDGHTQYGGNDEVFDLLIGSEALPTAMTQRILEGLSVNETYPLSISNRPSLSGPTATIVSPSITGPRERLTAMPCSSTISA